MKTLLFLILTISAYGQQAIEGVTYSADALEASRRFILAQASPTSTTLAAPVAPGDTTYTLQSITGIAVGDQLLCEGDAALVTAVKDNVVTVTRSTLGTTAADHKQGASVVRLKYRSVQQLYRQVRIDVASALLAQFGSQTVDARKAAIQAAQDAITAAQTAAAQ